MNLFKFRQPVTSGRRDTQSGNEGGKSGIEDIGIDRCIGQKRQQRLSIAIPHFYPHQKGINPKRIFFTKEYKKSADNIMWEKWTGRFIVTTIEGWQR